MEQITVDKSFDSTFTLLKEGYKFIPNRAHELNSDVFDVHLMLQNVTCMFGEEAAELFYDQAKFTRKGALPPTALRLLQDKRSVMVQDDEVHYHRKQMFLSLMSPEKLPDYLKVLEASWRKAMRNWEKKDIIQTQMEVENILTEATCAWAGVPLDPQEIDRRARDFSQMVDGTGSIGPRNWRGFRVRHRTESWILNYVKKVRSGELKARASDPATIIAQFKDLNGKIISEKTAVEEIINILRPTIAVSRYIAFSLHALHFHPQCAELIRKDKTYLRLFTQEVRRYYPFIPFLGGRVREDFEWKGMTFPKGKLVLLDIYGTNHDPRTYHEPHKFNPERFRNLRINANNLVPQGAGDHAKGHRCPGEWLTIAMMEKIIHLMVNDYRYEVPEQDLRVDLSRIPARVNSGMLISELRPFARTVDEGDVAAL